MDDYFSAVQNQIAQNNSWSAEQAQKQMDFQERMSNTAHQREVADLKAAGLNPVLSARLGGASTPSGAMAAADPAATTSFVSLLNKVLDIQADNAKAQMYAAAQSGDGSAYGQLSTDDQNSLLKLVTKGQVDKNTASAISNVIGNVVSNGKKLWNTVKESDTVKSISGALNNAVSFWKNPVENTKNSNIGSKVVSAVKGAVNAAKNFGTWLVTGKKSSKNS